MATVQQLTGEVTPSWCPGCGDFSILAVLRMAISELNFDPKDVVIVSGIGCGSKTPHYVKTYGFESLHGRALPIAAAVKLANHKLHVICIGGDGDGYGIGLAHFLHNCRRNINVTYLVQNNMVYGLTKGQTSPTSEKGFKSNSTPSGVLEVPVNPLALALSAGASFVARGFSNDIVHLKALFKEAITHKGFAHIDIFQPCSTYNHTNTPEWYKSHIYNLDKDAKYDKNNYMLAMEKALQWGEKIPIGIFFKDQRPTYEDGLPQLSKAPLVEHDISHVEISELLVKYR